jgi:histidyl-tRNA synthetase
VLVVGQNEIETGSYTLKNLSEETLVSGNIEELIQHITDLE